MDRKHCLVTGANRGLGLELVRQLLGRHCHVVATCRQPGKATALNTLAGEHPGRLHVLPLDVADPRSRAELVRELPLVTDEESLHLLINNAGVLRGGERFGQVAPADLDASFHTNAAGPFLLTQALAPRLAEGGVVANISSEVGSIGLRQEFRTPSYAIGKAAQNMATSLLVPLVLAMYPGGDTSIAVLLVAVVVPVFNVMSTIALMVYSDARQGGAWSVVKGIVLNPLIIATALGLAA